MGDKYSLGQSWEKKTPQPVKTEEDIALKVVVRVHFSPLGFNAYKLRTFQAHSGHEASL